MSAKQRYYKLQLFQSDKVTGKNSTVGCVVIADYMDSQNQRTILVERPFTAQGHRATKPKAKKVDAKAPATSFNDAEKFGG